MERETGGPLEPVDDTIELKQRRRVPLSEIARTAFQAIPRRTALGLSLFVGQAFLYNAITFDLGTLSKYFDVASGTVPVYFVISRPATFSVHSFSGRFFDTVGRQQMVTATYASPRAEASPCHLDRQSISSAGRSLR